MCVCVRVCCSLDFVFALCILFWFLFCWVCFCTPWLLSFFLLESKRVRGGSVLQFLRSISYFMISLVYEYFNISRRWSSNEQVGCNKKKKKWFSCVLNILNTSNIVLALFWIWILNLLQQQDQLGRQTRRNSCVFICFVMQFRFLIINITLKW